MELDYPQHRKVSTRRAGANERVRLAKPSDVRPAARLCGTRDPAITYI